MNLTVLVYRSETRHIQTVRIMVCRQYWYLLKLRHTNDF